MGVYGYYRVRAKAGRYDARRIATDNFFFAEARCLRVMLAAAPGESKGKDSQAEEGAVSVEAGSDIILSSKIHGRGHPED